MSLSVDSVSLTYFGASRTDPHESEVVLVMRGVSLKVQEGEILALIGRSGCGKSTFLRAIAGYHRPSMGSIVLSGSSGKTSIQMVHQDALLFPWLTVLQNVAFSMRWRPSDSFTEEECWKLLARLGIESRASAYPSMLSGGERQRVAIAQALAARPHVLLLDEPFASLDLPTRDIVFSTIRDSCKGSIVMLVTHDLDDAQALASRIVVFGGRPTEVRADHDIASIEGPSFRSKIIRAMGAIPV